MTATTLARSPCPSFPTLSIIARAHNPRSAVSSPCSSSDAISCRFAKHPTNHLGSTNCLSSTNRLGFTNHLQPTNHSAPLQVATKFPTPLDSSPSETLSSSSKAELRSNHASVRNTLGFSSEHSSFRPHRTWSHASSSATTVVHSHCHVAFLHCQLAHSHRRAASSHRLFAPSFQQAQRRLHLRPPDRWCQKTGSGVTRRKGPVCRVVEDRPVTEGEEYVASKRQRSDNKAFEKGRGEEVEPAESGGLARFGERLRDRLNIDDLWWEILVVSFPALLALAADPVASLFETSLLGNLGPAQLAAAGVSINVFNTLCKLFNFPLLNVTTSFVAEAETQSKLEREELLKSLGQSPVERSQSFQSATTTRDTGQSLRSGLAGRFPGTEATAGSPRQASDGLGGGRNERLDEGLRERRASSAGASTSDGLVEVRSKINGRERLSKGDLWTSDGVLETSEFRTNPERRPTLNTERAKLGADQADGNAGRDVVKNRVNSANLENDDGATQTFDIANLESSDGVTKPVNTAVSASVIVGAALGIVESLVLGLGARNILGLYGTNAEMMGPASMYLALRAIGAPALVVSLAVSGAFRGFGDTKTPLYAQVASNVLNVTLLPLFMFTFGWGIAGAAAATVTSQYVQMTILLVCISRRCQIVPRRWQDLNFKRFVGAGGVLLGRTLASLFTMSLATSMAARTGTASMAAHQICIQVWLAASLLSDSVALAGQTILARAFAQDDVSLIDTVARRIMKLGLFMGGAMAAVFLVGRYAIPLAFTHDPAVLAIIASLLPFIVLTQPVNALAFVWDGLHYGASDFVYSAQVMVLAAIPAMAAMFFLPQHLGIAGVWVGLAVLMSARALLGVGRYATKSGPWEKLKDL